MVSGWGGGGGARKSSPHHRSCGVEAALSPRTGVRLCCCYFLKRRKGRDEFPHAPNGENGKPCWDHKASSSRVPRSWGYRGPGHLGKQSCHSLWPPEGGQVMLGDCPSLCASPRSGHRFKCSDRLQFCTNPMGQALVLAQFYK